MSIASTAWEFSSTCPVVAFFVGNVSSIHPVSMNDDAATRAIPIPYLFSIFIVFCCFVLSFLE